MSTSRRRFLRSSALAAAAASVAPLAAADQPAPPARSTPLAPSDDPRMLYYDQFYFKEKPIFRFMLPNQITAYLREHQGWMDPESGIIFYNGVMPTTCEWIPTTQTEWLHHRKLDNPKQNLLINIAGHEQYWWPFDRNYQADIFERWDTALRHVTEHGYKPIWIDDGFFGGCD